MQNKTRFDYAKVQPAFSKCGAKVRTFPLPPNTLCGRCPYPFCGICPSKSPYICGVNKKK